MTPLDVYKKLPRTNCGQCPAGTCMSFAVQFLMGMTSSMECPELDEQSRIEIDAMLSDSGDWKEKRLQELFKEVEQMDFSVIAEGIGAIVENDTLNIEYMGEGIGVKRNNFLKELDIWDKLLILMYVRKAGSSALSGKWIAFRDLKGGMIRAESFHGACEIPLAKMFEHDNKRFLKKLFSMGAEKVEGSSAEHSFVFSPLPKIPFLIVLWHGDEEFGAECKVLLDERATDFLDVEALLYLGMALVRVMK